MANAKRTVDVEIKVTGVKLDQLTKIASAFESIGDSVKKASEAVTEFKSAVDSIKAPTGLTAVVESTKELSKISVPNIKQIAQGFERLSKMGSPPDLSKFATEAERFGKIKVPNIKGLAVGLEKLTASSLNMGEAGARLRIVYRNIKRFSDINVPNITKIAQGLAELNKVSAINVQTKSLTTLADVLTRLNGVKAPSLTAMTKGLKDLSGSSVNIDKAVRSLQQLSGVLNQFADRKLPSVTGLVTGLQKLIDLNVGTVAKKIRDLNAALKLLDKSGSLTAFRTFATDLNKVSTEAIRATTETKKFTASATRAASATKTWGDRIRNYFQYRMIADGIMFLREAILGAVSVISEYDQALKDLQAITGATGLEVEQMGEKIKEVAATTKFSASEVAEGMRTLGQAGFSASESIQTMQAVSDLATGTLSDMKTTVDLISTAMRVFQIDASESGRVADVFANAVNRSKLTIDKLRTAFNYVGPIAKEAGASFEEVNAAMMTLANAGLRASTIGTGLRRVFAELVDPSDKLRAAASGAGVALTDLDIGSNSLQDVIRNLGLVVDDAGVAFDLFGKRGAAAVLSLTDNNGQFSELMDTVTQSGTASNMAAIQMEGLAVSFKNLKDRLGVLAIAIGELGITDAMRAILDISRLVVDAITTLVDNPMAKFIGKASIMAGSIWLIVKAFAGLSGAGTILLGMAKGMGAVTASFVTAEAAVGGLALLMNPLIAVIGLVAVALGSMAMKAIDAGKATTEMADEALKSAQEYGTLAKSAQDYSIKISTLSEDSEAFADANKQLRQDLLNTADGMTEISDEAEAAATAIDPLTGKFYDGGEALRIYNEELKNLQMTEFVNSLNGAFQGMEEGTNKFARSVNYMQTSLGDVGEGILTGLVDFGNTAIQSVLHPIQSFKGEVGGFEDTLDVFKNSGAIASAYDFAAALNSGEKSFQDLNDYVEGFKGHEMNAQMEELANYLQNIKEKIAPVFNHLRQIGTIDTSYTVEEMEKVLSTLGLSTQAVDALLLKFNDLKEAELGGFSNIVEKWQQDLKSTENTYDSLVQTATEAGLKLTDVQKGSLKASQDAKEALIKQLDAAKALRDESIDETSTFEEKKAAWESYYTTLDTILGDAKQIQKEYADDTVAQDVTSLSKLVANRDKKLKEANALYSDNAKLLQKEIHKINNEFVTASNRITENLVDPVAHLSATKVAIKALKEEYAEMNKELELSVLTPDSDGNTADRKAVNEEKRKNEALLADEIVAIWENAEEEIIKASDPQSNQAKAARSARLQAQIDEGNLSVAQAKKIAQEINKAQQDVYKNQTAERETGFSAYVARIEQAEAQNTITHSQAEASKLQATLDFYDKAYQASVDYTNQVDSSAQPQEYAKRYTAQLAAEKKFYDQKAQLAESHNKKVASIEESLETKDDDRIKKEEKTSRKIEEIEYSLGEKKRKINQDAADKIEDLTEDLADDIEDINEDLADDIRDINEDLADDLDDINDERIENAKDLRAAIEGIEEDTADKIRKVNQRGMSDKQKDRDNEKAAYKKLADAKKLQIQAEKTGNAELAKQAAEQLKSAQSLAEGLDSAKKAKSLLYDTGDALKDNAVIQKNIADRELEKKAVEAVAEAEKKKADARRDADKAIQDANDTYTKEVQRITEAATKRITEAERVAERQETLETARHTREMGNLDKEVAKLREKLELNKQLAQAAGGDVLGDAEVSPGSGTSSPASTTDEAQKSLQEVQNIAKATQDAINGVTDTSKQASSSIGTDLANSLGTASKDAAKGFEEFIVVTNEAGETMITTANTAAQGFAGFGNIVKTEPLVAMKELSTAAKEITQNPIDLQVESNVREKVDEFKSLTTELNNQKAEMGHFITDEALGRIDETRDKISGLFDGLEASSPEQKVADMMTMFNSLDGVISDSSLMDFFAEIQTEAAKLDEPVEIQMEMNGDDVVISAVGEAGAKFDELQQKFESNPFDLSETLVVDEVAQGLGEIDGLMDAVKEKAREEVTLELDTETAKQDVAALENETPEAVEMEVTADTSQATQELDALEDVEVNIPVTVTGEEAIATVKAEIQTLEEAPVNVEVVLDAEEINELTTELKAVENTDVEVNASVNGSDDVQSLITWLGQLDSHNPKNVNVSADVEGDDDVVSLKQAIDSLVNKTVRIVADVSGLSDVQNLKSAIDSLKDKTITITTKYKTVGSPPSESKATGGEIQGFNSGGQAFPRLVNRFITAGRGLADDVPAMLMKGEFVHKVASVRKYGKAFMESVNNGTFPLAAVQKAVPHFANGGDVQFDLGSSSIVQQFNKGGLAVSGMIGGLKKRIYELLGQKDPGVKIDTVSFNDVVNENRSGITSELGATSINKMSEAFQSTVQQFATGGGVRQIDTSQLNKTINGITSVYDDLITTEYTTSGGNTEKLKVLEEERKALLKIAESLKAKIAELTATYNEDVTDAEADRDESYADAQESHDDSSADAQENHDETVADATENYNEQLADRNEQSAETLADAKEDYDDTAADNQEDYDDTESDYNEDNADALADYNEEKADIEEDYEDNYHELWQSLIDARSAAREAVGAVNDFGSTYGKRRQNKKVVDTWRHDGYDIPRWDELENIVKQYWANDNMVPAKYKQDKLDYSLERASAKWSDWLGALTGLQDLGIDEKDMQRVMDGDIDLSKLSETLSSGGQQALIDEAYESYSDTKADNDENWADYQEDHAEKEADNLENYNEKVEDENESLAEALADYLESFTETKTDAAENLSENLANYLENLADSKLNADESLNDSLENLLSTYNDNIDTANSEAEADTVDQKSTTQGELEDLLSKASEQDTSTSNLSFASATDAASAFASAPQSVEDLLRRLGQNLFRFNSGGDVPHTSWSIPGKDSLMAALTPGEFVVRAPVVEKFGSGFFNALNNFQIPKFNLGGVVGTVANSFSNAVQGSEIKHALELSINGNAQEPLYGSEMGIDSIINSLEMAKARS